MGLNEIQHFLVLTLAIVLNIVTFSNLRFLESLKDSLGKENCHPSRKLVSILVPARNEEERIHKCLRALASQRYDCIEIIILDDRSTDRTAEIIQSFLDSDTRMRMIAGTELPNGWVGKNWACDQLFNQAAGDLLLFMDADTILAEGTVSASIFEATRSEIDLLTIMPNRTADCIVEKFLFPFVDWALFCWIPLGIAHSRRIPHLSVTFGQFMLFKRDAYELIGGHARIRNNPLDDFQLGRFAKNLGLKWMLFGGRDCVETLAYKSNTDAFKSVSRSVFPVLDYRVSTFVVLCVTLVTLGFVPLITLVKLSMFGTQLSVVAFSALASLGLLFTSWFIVCLKFKHSVLTALLFPMSIALLLVVGIHSIATYALQNTKWKERGIVERRIRF